MRGIWYGIGVGPGDPELMTIKAVNRLKACDWIAVPHEVREQCTAYQIAVQAVPELSEKPCLCLHMPMTKEKALLEASHCSAAEQSAQILEQGLDVAFLTLGDSTVYSTCLYVMERLNRMGYRTELINGIPSFCAAAARLGIPLVNGKETLHLIPASYPMEEMLALSGTKVLMKAGRRFSKVKEYLKERECEVFLVENCGMETERIYRNLDELPENPGYFSILLVR